MRMRNVENNTEINVIRHLILKNFWEVYITDEETNSDDIKFALVMGYETELGDVSLEEYKGHIILSTDVNEETEIAPATGWTWEN
jgi:hypothetical protein